MKNLLILLSIVSFVFGCSSTTTITSTDKDAKIYVDGEYKGKGSVSHTDTKIVGSSTVVKITKKGCDPRTYTFSRNEEFDPGACAGGVFTLVPFLWIMKYKPVHSYDYQCKEDE